MKTNNLKVLLQLVIVFIFIGMAYQTQAQHKLPKAMPMAQKKQDFHKKGQGQFCGIPDLTEDQKKKMKEMHLKLMKETLPVKNALREKKARLKTLTTVDNPDMNEINKLIDEMTQLKGDLMKKQIALKMEIRKELTDEQRIMFDSKSQKQMGHSKKKGQGHF